MPATSRLDQIQTIFSENNLPSYRFAQIKAAIYADQFTRYSQISTLSKDIRAQLTKELGDEILSLKKVTEVEGDNAHKVLFETRDGKKLETVRLTYKDHTASGESRSQRTALCLSTQSGCALGCVFCATGALGLMKNLTSDEILDQVLYFTKAGHRIDRLIFMGMGEPFSNPDSTFAALTAITDPGQLAMSPYRISVSTVGIIPGIKRLTKDFPQVNLAFSLHSPFPGERRQLMPITNAYPIDKVMAAIDEHLKITNHKVFISYILLNGINDKSNDAGALSDLIKATPDRLRLLHVNLIRFNPGPTKQVFQKSDAQTVRQFQDILDHNKIKNTLRQDFGVKINAACGQLAGESQLTPRRNN